jgi:hypothetical protein
MNLPGETEAGFAGMQPSEAKRQLQVASGGRSGVRDSGYGIREQIQGTGRAVAPNEAKRYFGVTMKTARRPSRFHVVVDAADRLTVDEQEALVAVLNRRLADRRPAELARDIREGQKEFARGALRPSTPEKIVKEILS